MAFVLISGKPTNVGDGADEIIALRAKNTQLLDLCRLVYEELNCGEDGDIFDRTHYCGRCDHSIDRNGILRKQLVDALITTT